MMSGQRDEIILGDVGRADRISIETNNSRYVFIVTDPAGRGGILFGGAAWRRPVRACLPHERLRTGSNALFLISSGAKFLFANTSRVRRIEHIRRGTAVAATTVAREKSI